jgi:hypothetical protein
LVGRGFFIYFWFQLEGTMSNIRVVLVHKGDTSEMRRTATRVIDGRLLKAGSLDGRVQEAKAIYNKMLGIKSTVHEYEIVETDEPPYVPAPMPVSDAGAYQRRKEDEAIERVAEIIARKFAAAFTAPVMRGPEAAAPVNEPDPTALPVEDEPRRPVADSGPMRSRTKPTL